MLVLLIIVEVGEKLGFYYGFGKQWTIFGYINMNVSLKYSD